MVDICCNATKSTLLDNQWPVVNENRRHVCRYHAHRQHARPNVDMLSRLRLCQTPGEPVALIEIVRIKRSTSQPVGETWISIDYIHPPGSGMAAKCKTDR